jgi:perosamine synthetase
MGNLQAAFGCAQMEHWDQVVTERHHIIGRYGSLLSELTGVKLQAPGRDVEPLVWAVAVELDPATYTQGRDGVLQEMSDLGVECRNGFYSPSQMPLYEPYRCITPVSDRLAQNVISLPTFVGLTDAEIDRVVETLRSLARK